MYTPWSPCAPSAEQRLPGLRLGDASQVLSKAGVPSGALPACQLARHRLGMEGDTHMRCLVPQADASRDQRMHKHLSRRKVPMV